jgi:hypothetical protein
MQSDHLPLGKMRSSKSLVVDNNEDSMWKFYPKSIKKISCNHSCELNLHYICDAICIYHVCTPWRECTYLLRMHLLAWNLVLLFVLRINWNAFWNPTACWVGLSEDLTLLTKVDIFRFVSLVAGERKVL